jgi:hypothetical protein
MGPVQTKSTGVGPQVQPKHAGFPCAMVYGLLRALPGDRAFLPPSLHDQLAKLSASIGAPGPHDFAVRAGQVRLPWPFASTASHRNVPDDRDPPLIRGETRRAKALICPTAKAEYFCAEGWTDFRRFARQAIWPHPKTRFRHCKPTVARCRGELHAGTGSGWAFAENGLKVIAIRKAPSPTAQDPI